MRGSEEEASDGQDASFRLEEEKQLTSSQSPEGKGIPTLAGRVSCFVGESFTCAVAATSQRFRLHRHWLSASPAVASRVSAIITRLGSHLVVKERENVQWSNAGVFLPKEPYLGTSKHSSVVKVLRAF